IEWGGMQRAPRILAYAGAVLLVALLLGAAQWLYPSEEMDVAIAVESLAPAWTGFGLAVLGGLLLGLASRRVMMAAGFVYVAIPAFALVVLDWLRFDLVFWAMVVT